MKTQGSYRPAIWPLVLVLLLLSRLNPLAAQQETRGTIQGRVMDPQGQLVAGATVTVINVETNTSVIVSSNSTGYYEARLLLPGNYRLAADFTGFKHLIRDGIVLSIGSQLEINLTLELGQATQSVLVTAETPMLEVGTQSTGGLFDNREVMDLPTPGNNPLALARLNSDVQTGGLNPYLNLAATATASDYFVGGNVGGNDWSVDGMTSNGPNRRTAYLPYSDAIQEFRVDTLRFDASAGRGTGVNVTAISKAGTNRYHGTLTEQMWQQRWNAAPFFVKQLYYRQIADANAKGDTSLADTLRNSPMQPSAHMNNYAATFGGPVTIPGVVNGKDKLFFYFSYNHFTQIQTPSSSSLNYTVPTVNNLQGDFSDLLRLNAAKYQLYDPLTVQRDPARPGHYIRQPIPGNVIPKSRMINPVYQSYIKLLPSPNNSPVDIQQDPLNNYLAVAMQTPWYYTTYHGRVDYHRSEKHRFYARLNFSPWLLHSGNWLYDSAPGLMDFLNNDRIVGSLLNWTYTAGPRTLVTFAIGGSEFRQWTTKPGVAQYKPSDVGLPTYMDAFAGNGHMLPIMTFSGYSGINSGPTPIYHPVRIYEASSDMTRVQGEHTLRAGFDSRYHFSNGSGGGSPNGSFAFDSTYTRKADDTYVPAGTLGFSWAAFAMGIPSTMSATTDVASYAMYSPYYGGYIQDAWRINRNFTLNLGLRLEYEIGPTERYNRMIGSFDRTARLPITEAAQAVYAAKPLSELPASAFTVLGGTLFPGLEGTSRQYIGSQLMWMPRLGIGYELNARTALRAGYGMFFDTFNPLDQAPNQTGFNRTTSGSISTDSGLTWLTGDPAAGISPLADPFPARADGTHFFTAPAPGVLGLMTMAGQGFTFTDYDTERARQQRWQAGIQRQVTTNMSVSVSYVGSYSDRVYINRKLNTLPSQYWATGLVRNDTQASYLQANVSNPFYIGNFPNVKAANQALYDNMASFALFRGTTIQRQQLLRAFPQMTSLTQQYAPLGKSRTDSLQIRLQRRFSKGLSLNAGYIRLRTRAADYFANEFDPQPTWRESNYGRPHRFTATGIYELPFGKGRPFLTHGLSNKLLGGFQVAATYEWQPGPLVQFGNLFYYGDMNQLAKDVQPTVRTLNQWFNTANFERNSAKVPNAYHVRAFPTQIDGLRADMTSQCNANLQRNFRIAERATLSFRLDVLNVQNRSQFASPNTTPTDSTFGKVTTQSTSINRFLQIQGRITF